MPYTVRRSPVTGKRTVVFQPRPARPRKIEKRGNFARSIVVREGREYHVTKGWRQDAPAGAR